MTKTPKRVTIIDYHMGNTQSVANACEELGAAVVISSREEDIRNSDCLVLPGVGAFGEGMRHLRDLDLIRVLGDEVLNGKKPFLGICLGMQVLADMSFEFGEYEGLGWISGKVHRLKAENLRLPHVGWNDVKFQTESPLFQHSPPASDFYFVHSYHFAPENPDVIEATCEYGEEFAAAVRQDNLFGVQFHPEKSQKAGKTLLENFLSLI